MQTKVEKKLLKQSFLDIIVSDFLTPGVLNHQHIDPTPEINIIIITIISYIT